MAFFPCCKTFVSEKVHPGTLVHVIPPPNFCCATFGVVQFVCLFLNKDVLAKFWNFNGYNLRQINKRVFSLKKYPEYSNKRQKGSCSTRNSGCALILNIFVGSCKKKQQQYFNWLHKYVEAKASEKTYIIFLSSPLF